MRGAGQDGRVPSAVPTPPGSHPSGHAAGGVDGAPRVDPSRMEPDEIVWLRDLDGTGSMHPCAPHDPGAIRYIREDLF